MRLLESCFYAMVLIALIYFGLEGFDRLVLNLGINESFLGRYKASIVPIVVLMTLIYPAAYGYRRAFSWTAFQLPLGDRLLMVGDGPMANTIEKELKDLAEPGVTIRGYILPDGEEGDTRLIRGHRVLGGFDALMRESRANNIDRIIVCLPERRGHLPVMELLNCRLQGFKIDEGESLYERLTGKIAIAKLRPSYLIFSEGFHRSRTNYVLKRLSDITLATAGLIASLPITILTAIAIKATSRGPILFNQSRVGREGRIFTLYKFRSMRSDAEKDSGPVWASTDDDRVTAVGRIIRKLRIDEIPQFINVLRNEMSFVGPRPERPFFVEELTRDISYYTQRLVVKPGITGWAQVNYRYGASKEDAIEKLQYDLYYIKNLSLTLDIFIAFRTIRVVLLGFGAR